MNCRGGPAEKKIISLQPSHLNLHLLLLFLHLHFLILLYCEDILNLSKKHKVICRYYPWGKHSSRWETQTMWSDVPVGWLLRFVFFYLTMLKVWECPPRCTVYDSPLGRQADHLWCQQRARVWHGLWRPINRAAGGSVTGGFSCQCICTLDVTAYAGLSSFWHKPEASAFSSSLPRRCVEIFTLLPCLAGIRLA